MSSTFIVLVVVLLAHRSVSILALAASLFLARRDGQRLKSMSWSLRGYTAEFHDIKEPQSGDN